MFRRHKRSNYELKKLADLWLDGAKYIVVTFVIKFWESGFPPIFSRGILTLAGGLILSVSCATIGLKFARLVKNHE